MKRTVWHALAAAILINPFVDPHFDREMARQMLLQIPALFWIGFSLGSRNSERNHFCDPNGLSGLVFLVGTVAFWFTPRSLDMAVIFDPVDQLMHLNFLVAGFLFAGSVRRMGSIIKIAAGIYALSMVLAMGMLYLTYDSLLCTTYTIEQQKEVGRMLIFAFFPLFFIFFVFASRLLFRPEK